MDADFQDINEKQKKVFSQSSGLKGNQKNSVAQAQGVRPAHGRTASAGIHRIPERLLGFCKAPVPAPLGESRIADRIGPTQACSDANR
jgi:hypothetical protein